MDAPEELIDIVEVTSDATPDATPEATPDATPEATPDAGVVVKSDERARESLDEFIDRDVAARLRKTNTWRQMDLCHKWRLVNEYLRSIDLAGNTVLVAELRGLLRSNDLPNVSYNGERIERLNHGDL